jgi:K+-sensing histidine kinase KdpD
MASKIKKIRDSMDSRPDPLMFRGMAYVAAVGVVGTDLLLGARLWSVLGATLLIATASFIFPIRTPNDNFRKKTLVTLRAIRQSSWWVRFAVMALMTIGVSVFDSYLDLKLGRHFNMFLIPIFLVSLLFGLPLAILSWLLSVLAVYYCVIPPKNSFELGSLKDFADLFGFFYLGLVTLAIPTLIRSSSVEAD